MHPITLNSPSAKKASTIQPKGKTIFQFADSSSPEVCRIHMKKLQQKFSSSQSMVMTAFPMIILTINSHNSNSNRQAYDIIHPDFVKPYLSCHTRIFVYQLPCATFSGNLGDIGQKESSYAPDLASMNVILHRVATSICFCQARSLSQYH